MIIVENLYKISGTNYINPPDYYKNVSLYPKFKEDIENFKITLSECVENESNKTFYKFGDGDYYFLKKIPRGSAKPGRRAISKSYDEINHEQFVLNSQKNDFYLSLISKPMSIMFKEIFNAKPNFPSEFVYGLLSNKWILKNFSGKIGLIGADKKIKLIKKLMQEDEYKEYIGLDQFNDYIKIPQNFACDNLDQVKKSVDKQLKKTTSKIFLVGVGHIKSGLLNELKSFNNAVYLDVGVGIDALAGIVNINRPYFGNWKNFQLENKNLYKKLDILINNSGSFGAIKVIK
jgi:hypothetical protein